MKTKKEESEKDFEVIHEEDTESLLPDNLNVNLVKKTQLFANTCI